jgi:NitT/TauT family transport system permease protein
VASTNLDTGRVFALILYLSLLGLGTYGLVIWLERKIVFWQRSSARIAS